MTDNTIIQKLRDRINEYFVGKEDVVENVLICLLAGGHILIEDVPGVGKTTLVKILSAAVNMSFSRIQFTPDTLPGDVVGVSVYNMKTGEFEYKEGAIMHQIILADEINRTSPKTQAALLESMAEKSVTVDGVRYDLPDPFMVIATQNPVEFIGTYPLPEASVDRFLMRLCVGYPEKAEELRLARNFIEGKYDDPVSYVCTAADICNLKNAVNKVSITDNVIDYAREIIDLTRKENRFIIGASPRALLALIKASQAKAFLSSRDFVKPDDIKAVAVNVLHHRLTLTPEAKIAGENIDSIIAGLMFQVKVPTE
ncbi:MAG: MoxR family ATPase [Lachnospiraceae bacterium]|nr:MoxR family ATPase [Lachnospiraceae bacterium]